MEPPQSFPPPREGSTLNPEPPQPPRFSIKQVLALVAILIGAAVPVAWQFGLDLCAITNGVGIRLDACALPAPAVTVTPAAPLDAGAPQ